MVDHKGVLELLQYLKKCVRRWRHLLGRRGTPSVISTVADVVTAGSAVLPPTPRREQTSAAGAADGNTEACSIHIVEVTLTLGRKGRRVVFEKTYKEFALLDGSGIVLDGQHWTKLRPDLVCCSKDMLDHDRAGFLGLDRKIPTSTAVPTGAK